MKFKVYSVEEYDELEIKPEEFLPSTITGIDNIVGGFCRGELTIIGAPSNNGKSIISMSSALNMAINYQVLYISLENSLATDDGRRKEIIQQYNLIDDELKFDYVNTDLNDEEDYYAMVSLTDIDEMLDDKAYDIVFVDSIDFIGDVMGQDDGMKSFSYLNQLSAGLRKIAAKHNCAVITTTQLGRSSAKKAISEMSMGDIQGSVGIVQKAHCVWFISKVDNWAIKMVKNRCKKKDVYPDDIFYMGNKNNAGFDIRQDGGQGVI